MESGDGLNRAPQRSRPAGVEQVGAVESSAQVICHLAENSREAERRRRRPITVDPNKLTDDPHYDTDPIWNQIDKYEP